MFALGDVVVNERADWGARPPKSVTHSSAPYGLTVHYEGPQMGSFPHSSCASKVRGIQNYHMDGQGWSDIAYNWMVCPHGAIYGARGANVKTAANGTTLGNSTARTVCCLWGQGDPQPDAAKHAIRALFDFLMWVGDCGPGINCHKDWKATACPGDICGWVKEGAVDPIGSNPAPIPGRDPLPPPVYPYVPYVPQLGPTPGVCIVGPDVYTFARGLDARLWLQRNGDGWIPTDGGLSSGPTAVFYQGQIHIFAVGLDNALYHKWGIGDTWSQWESLGGVLTSGVSASTDGTRIEVAARGTDTAVYRKAWTGAVWTDWWTVGGGT